MKYLLKPNRGMELKHLMFAALLLIPFPGSGQRDPYLAGRALMVQESYDSAVVFLTQALESRPGDAEMLYFLGLAQFSRQDYPSAREAFYEAERRRKGMGSFYLAKTEVKLNHPELALKYLKVHLESRYRRPEPEILLDGDLSTLEKHPGWGSLWEEKPWYSSGDLEFQQALFLKESGDRLEAINILNRLEKQGYERSRVQSEKAAIYALLDNEKAARSELRSAVKSDVRNLDALQELARYQIRDGDAAEAVEGLNRLIRQDPARFEAYVMRAEARGMEGDLQGAMEDMERYLTYFPLDDEALYRKGVIQYDNGRYLDAIQSFNRALELNRGNPEYYFARGKTYATTGTTRYADKDLSMALDLDPFNGQIWYEKGKVSVRLGKASAACHCYEKAFQYGVYEAREYLERNCNPNGN